jgi:predicted Zn-dependent protease
MGLFYIIISISLVQFSKQTTYFNVNLLDDISEINYKVWSKNYLKWTIRNNPKSIDASKQYLVFHEFDKAFKSWERISHFKFEYVEQNSYSADIVINFIAPKHMLSKDDQYFVNGVLAHAFFPVDGDIHFNNNVNWSLSFYPDLSNFSIFLVAIHEIGHSLGLNHVMDTASVMYPLYINRNYTALNFEFNSIDKELIKKLYPETKTSPTITTTTTTKSTTQMKSESSSTLLTKPQTKSTYPATTASYQSEEYPDYSCKIIINEDRKWCEDDLIFNPIFEIDGYIFLYKNNNFWIYNEYIKPKKFDHLEYWKENRENLISILKIDSDFIFFYKNYALIKKDTCDDEKTYVNYSLFDINDSIDGIYYNSTTDIVYLFSKYTSKTYFKIFEFSRNYFSKPHKKPIELWKMKTFDYDVVFTQNDKVYFIKKDIVDYFDLSLRRLIKQIEFKDLFLGDQCNIFPMNWDY